ncbi:MAG: peptidase M14 [Gemmatimonadaceae bacterium]|nr:peptidase M14 [Gemmatimonadaceae bacterium]
MRRARGSLRVSTVCVAAPSRYAVMFATAATVMLMACSSSGPNSVPRASDACCLETGRMVAAQYRVSTITTRRFTHRDLWAALDPVVKAPVFRTTTFGASMHGRPLRAITFGTGPTTVLLWSQMHGDESTATMSLADILTWFAEPKRDRNDVRDLLASRLTIVMVPMLNPDGAELFQRENAMGVDVNRDARRLSTPEARALKALRDSIMPAFGFNLHDQNARTLGSSTGRQVGIALLAPAADAEKSYGPTRATARLVAATIRRVLEQEIPNRVARYDDAFNPRAFGDLIQQWGTSTVLIESGALPNDPEKQQLRRVNVIALLTALEAIATGGYRAADPALYDALPVNDRAAVDVLVLGADVVIPGQAPMRVDLAYNYDDALRKGRARIRDIGDLAAVVALDTIQASGQFVHPAPAMLTTQDGKSWLRVNAPVQFTIRRGPDAASALVREIGGTP